MMKFKEIFNVLKIILFVIIYMFGATALPTMILWNSNLSMINIMFYVISIAIAFAIFLDTTKYFNPFNRFK